MATLTPTQAEAIAELILAYDEKLDEVAEGKIQQSELEAWLDEQKDSDLIVGEWLNQMLGNTEA